MPVLMEQVFLMTISRITLLYGWIHSRIFPSMFLYTHTLQVKEDGSGF